MELSIRPRVTKRYRIIIPNAYFIILLKKILGGYHVFRSGGIGKELSLKRGKRLIIYLIRSLLKKLKTSSYFMTWRYRSGVLLSITRLVLPS